MRKIVASSSAGIYGELRTMPIQREPSLDPPDALWRLQAVHGKAMPAYAATHGIEAVALRYFNVYGPNQRFDAYGNVIPIFVFNALQGRPITIFGDGRQTRDFVNVADVVQANIKAAMATGVSGAFNVASATQTCILELAGAIRDGLGIPVEIEFGPLRAGDVEHSLADIEAASAAPGYRPQGRWTSGCPTPARGGGRGPGLPRRPGGRGGVGETPP
ncbi:MAG: NAD-dependent epimerase/dehydratase family protein [Thermomonas sp.]|nr:NAD-dependent epimerase/dehydratase family protein [Thermomonas sp.]